MLKLNSLYINLPVNFRLKKFNEALTSTAFLVRKSF